MGRLAAPHHERKTVPRAYVVNQVVVHDAAKYSAYAAKGRDAVEQFGGRILAAGGRVTTLEGEPLPPRVVIIEFPSFEAAEQYHASPEYQAAAELRRGAATVRFAVVEGLDAHTVG
jgi:uncharacterized protein (DUF1330 family)